MAENFTDFNICERPVGSVVTLMGIGAGGLGFNSRAGQVKRV